MQAFAEEDFINTLLQISKGNLKIFEWTTTKFLSDRCTLKSQFQREQIGIKRLNNQASRASMPVSCGSSLFNQKKSGISFRHSLKRLYSIRKWFRFFVLD
jgi:hypothetical protein